MLLAAPLRADLDHAVVLARRLAHLVALVDGLRQRLLDIDVLARLAGQDGGAGVPVVGSGDDHAVDVLVLEHPAKVFNERQLLLLGLADVVPHFGQDGVVDVAESLELGALLDGPQRHAAALVAPADQRQHHLFIGAHGGRVEIHEAAGGQHPGARALHK